MANFVIIAQFKLKPGTGEQARAAALIDAEASVRDEPGCQRFDVLVAEDDADSLALYEIYDDEAAFEAHLQTPHLKAFREAMDGITVERNVVRCQLQNPNNG